jgi:hypothetical protein
VTKQDDDALLKLNEEHSSETEGALNQMLETTIREAWLPKRSRGSSRLLARSCSTCCSWSSLPDDAARRR